MGSRHSQSCQAGIGNNGEVNDRIVICNAIGARAMSGSRAGEALCPTPTYFSKYKRGVQCGKV